MDDNSVKNSRIKILKPHAHLHTGRKSTKFQVNPMKDVGGTAETRSLGWPAGRTDGITHTWTAKGHFYIPPPTMLGDKKQHKEGICKVLGRSVIFSACNADFCLCPKVIITTLMTQQYVH